MWVKIGIIKMKNISLLFSTFVLLSGVVMATETIPAQTQLRVATFNVSMEALNYLPYVRGKTPSVKGNELSLALNEINVSKFSLSLIFDFNKKFFSNNLELFAYSN